MVDLTFINSDVHRNLVAKISEEAKHDDEVIGLLLQGSVARGESFATSDLDMLVLLKDGIKRNFYSEYRDGIVIEFKYCDFDEAVGICESTIMGIYNFLESKILFDPKEKLQQLLELSQRVFNHYRTPDEERKSIKYWLESSLIKIKASKDAGDELKASFVVQTTSWKILEGVWAVNNKPIPPNGSVLYHLRDLERVPGNFEKTIKSLFVGDVKQRIDSAIQIIEWAITCLSMS